jgi:hypothetical protein
MKKEKTSNNLGHKKEAINDYKTAAQLGNLNPKVLESGKLKIIVEALKKHLQRRESLRQNFLRKRLNRSSEG